MDWSVIGSVLVTIVIAILIGSLLLKGKQRIQLTGKDVIICGPSGAGKTCLFLRLVTDHLLPTVQSATSNTGTSEMGRSIVDIPGSPKLFYGLFDAALPTAKCVILMLDGTRVSSLHHDMAQILYILSRCISRQCPILLVAGKEDTAGPTVLASITAALDDELGRLTHQQYEDEDEEDSIRADLQIVLTKAGLQDNPEALSMAALASQYDFHSIAYHDGNVNLIKEWIENKF